MSSRSFVAVGGGARTALDPVRARPPRPGPRASRIGRPVCYLLRASFFGRRKPPEAGVLRHAGVASGRSRRGVFLGCSCAPLGRPPRGVAGPWPPPAGAGPTGQVFPSWWWRFAPTAPESRPHTPRSRACPAQVAGGLSAAATGVRPPQVVLPIPPRKPLWITREFIHIRPPTPLSPKSSPHPPTHLSTFLPLF